MPLRDIIYLHQRQPKTTPHKMACSLAARLIQDDTKALITDRHVDPGKAAARRLGAGFVQTDVGKKADEADYITGTTIVVDGGQILPEAKN